MTAVVSPSGNSSAVSSCFLRAAAAESFVWLLLPLVFFLSFLEWSSSVAAVGVGVPVGSGCVYVPLRGRRQHRVGGFIGVCEGLGSRGASAFDGVAGDSAGAVAGVLGKRRAVPRKPFSAAWSRRSFGSNASPFAATPRLVQATGAADAAEALPADSRPARANGSLLSAPSRQTRLQPLFAENRATDLTHSKMTPQEEARLTPPQRAQVEENARNRGPWCDAADPYGAYVEMHGGKRVIRRILIANNGMAASKAIASMRQWAFDNFGDSHLLKFVAMASADDLDANSEFLKFADEVVPVPGGPSRNNYGNVDLICESAVKYKVDAVWPGWGHASENPALPAKLKELGVSFLGPSSSVMAALGDKIAANILAQTAGVPSIPWSGDGLTAQLDERGAIPEAIYQAATVHTLEDCRAAAQRIGYPLLLKASAGGGGKGIRVVFDDEALGPALAQVQAEVLGSPVFLMKLSRGARHIEVQIAGDCERQAVALSGRDCSTQRRFQKIFEEAPPTVVPKATFKEMERAAQRLTMSLGYQGLGTVEYLYDPSLNEFYFLELNPRLQVEHPVTEAVTDQNLPALQLQLGMEIPLRRIPSIRRLFGKKPETQEAIDFLAEDYQVPTKHVIAARVTAENPSDGFRPSSGSIASVDFQPPEGAWGYFAVASGGKIHAYADSQFGHIFAEGKDRDSARKRLIWALQRLRIRGTIRTPLFLLQRLLQHEHFKNHTLNTEWLDGIIKRKELLEGPRDQDVVFAGAVFRALEEMKKKEAEWVAMAERGHSYLPSVGSLLSEEVTLSLHDVEYKFQFTKLGPSTLGFKINDDSGFVEYRLQPDGALLLLIKQTRDADPLADSAANNARNALGLDQHPRMLRFFGQEEALGLLLQIEGQQLLLQQQQDPSLLRSEANGKVVRFLVPDGGVVEKGQAFAELEAMKMIMTLTAKEKGKITHLKSAGSLVAAGELLATLELEDASKVQTVTPFKGTFSVGSETSSQQPLDVQHTDTSAKDSAFCKVGEAAEAAEARLALLLDGYPQQLPLEKLLELALQRAETLEQVEELTTSCIAKFLAVEELFAGKEAIDAAEAVSAAAAGRPAAILDIHRSHFLLKHKTDLINLLLKTYRVGCRSRAGRGVGCCNCVFLASDWIPRQCCDAQKRLRSESEAAPGDGLLAVLGRLQGLRGCAFYDLLSLAAEKLLEELKLPALSQRVQRLRTTLQSLQSGVVEEESLLSEPEALGGFGVLSQLFEDKQVGTAAVSAAVKRQLSGLEVRDFAQPRQGVLRFSFNANPPRDEAGWAVERTRGLFVAFDSLDKLKLALAEAQRESGEGGAPRLLLLGASAPNEASAEAVSDEVQKALHEAFADPSVATALRELKTVRVLLPDGKGDARQFAFVRRDGDLEKTAPAEEAFVEDVQQRNRSEAQVLFSGVGELDREGTVRHFPSALASAAAPSAASVDSFVYGFSRKHHPPKPGARPSPPQETVFVHRLLSTRALQTEQLVSQLKQQLAVLTSSFKDAEAAKSASSVIVLQLAWPQEERQLPELRESLSRAVESLKATDGERLRALRVEAIELRAPIRTLEDNRRLAVMRAGSCGNGEWLELGDSEASEASAKGPASQLPPAPADPTLALLVQTLEKAEGMGGAGGARSSFSTSSTRSSRAASLLRSGAAESGSASSASLPSSGLSSAGSLEAASSQSPAERSSVALSPKETCSPTLRSLALERLAAKRAAAAKAGSTYIYDFVPLFKEGLKKLWRERRAQAAEAGVPFHSSVSDDLLSAEELLPDAQGELRFTPLWRVGDSPCGMVAFKLRIKTPDHPEGREVILIGNDVTFQGGSFGVKEHRLYAAASAYARKHKLPRIYIACNSGARIGLYDKIKHKIKVRWIDPENPHLGVESLALSEEDYEALPSGAVTGRWSQVVDSDGQPTSRREFVLDSIIGEDGQDLGVENLRGSGLIAGETSQAYEDIFTISLVSGRSVGIGAYVTRLAQRCIQREGAPLVLTGYQALNKLLGRDVYVSQAQLGGPEVMLPNGVSHLKVQSDLEGVTEILKWLEFVPRFADEAHSGSEALDSVRRRVDFQPTKIPYDPRVMLTGHALPESGDADKAENWVSGFFDKNSFVEVLSAWGAGVVVGRAKLGGIPVGVIAVDPRSTTASTPADPANPNSAKIVTPQAGQVWFPSTAYKTAQAINDFNRGENLPLIIFANWRGFSGGARDMFDEVLKFGSMIVDALRVYRHPVMVYIPPHAELRGGSWVVIDPSINPDMMELYADKDSRGGVLEPPGICEVKYKATDKKLLMQKNDHVIKSLHAALNEAKAKEADDQVNDIKHKIEEREEKLLPVYTQVAHMFADLHDKAPRMLAKGGVRRVLDWPLARQFFFWRIKRRLLSDPIIKEIMKDRPELSWSEAADIFKSAIPQVGEDVEDEDAVKFLQSQAGATMVAELLQRQQAEGTKRHLKNLLERLQRLPEADRQGLIQQLQHASHFFCCGTKDYLKVSNDAVQFNPFKTSNLSDMLNARQTIQRVYGFAFLTPNGVSLGGRHTFSHPLYGVAGLRATRTQMQAADGCERIRKGTPHMATLLRSLEALLGQDNRASPKEHVSAPSRAVQQQRPLFEDSPHEKAEMPRVESWASSSAPKRSPEVHSPSARESERTRLLGELLYLQEQQRVLEAEQRRLEQQQQSRNRREHSPDRGPASPEELRRQRIAAFALADAAAWRLASPSSALASSPGAASARRNLPRPSESSPVQRPPNAAKALHAAAASRRDSLEEREAPLREEKRTQHAALPTPLLALQSLLSHQTTTRETDQRDREEASPSSVRSLLQKNPAAAAAPLRAASSQQLSTPPAYVQFDSRSAPSAAALPAPQEERDSSSAAAEQWRRQEQLQIQQRELLVLLLKQLETHGARLPPEQQQEVLTLAARLVASLQQLEKRKPPPLSSPSARGPSTRPSPGPKAAAARASAAPPKAPSPAGSLHSRQGGGEGGEAAAASSLHEKIHSFVRRRVLQQMVLPAAPVDCCAMTSRFRFQNHVLMTEDLQRVGTYQRAIRYACQEGKKGGAGPLVIEIGTGPFALLSINAAREGAARVIAFEADRRSSSSAANAVKCLGFDKVVRVVRSYTTDLQPAQLSELLWQQLPTHTSEEALSRSSDSRSGGHWRRTKLQSRRRGDASRGLGLVSNEAELADAPEAETEAGAEGEGGGQQESAVAVSGTRLRSAETAEERRGRRKRPASDCSNPSSGSASRRHSASPPPSLERAASGAASSVGGGGDSSSSSIRPRDIWLLHEILGDFAGNEGAADVVLHMQQLLALVQLEHGLTPALPRSLPRAARTLLRPCVFPSLQELPFPHREFPNRSRISPRWRLLQAVGLLHQPLLLAAEAASVTVFQGLSEDKAVQQLQLHLQQCKQQPHGVEAKATASGEGGPSSQRRRKAPPVSERSSKTAAAAALAVLASAAATDSPCDDEQVAAAAFAASTASTASTAGTAAEEASAGRGVSSTGVKPVFEELLFEESMEQQLQQRRLLEFTVEKEGLLAGLCITNEIELAPGIALLDQELAVLPGDRLLVYAVADLQNFAGEAPLAKALFPAKRRRLRRGRLRRDVGAPPAAAGSPDGESETRKGSAVSSSGAAAAVSSTRRPEGAADFTRRGRGGRCVSASRRVGAEQTDEALAGEEESDRQPVLIFDSSEEESSRQGAPKEEGDARSACEEDDTDSKERVPSSATAPRIPRSLRVSSKGGGGSSRPTLSSSDRVSSQNAASPTTRPQRQLRGSAFARERKAVLGGRAEEAVVEEEVRVAKAPLRRGRGRPPRRGSAPRAAVAAASSVRRERREEAAPRVASSQEQQGVKEEPAAAAALAEGKTREDAERIAELRRRLSHRQRYSRPSYAFHVCVLRGKKVLLRQCISLPLEEQCPHAAPEHPRGGCTAL